MHAARTGDPSSRCAPFALAGMAQSAQHGRMSTSDANTLKLRLRSITNERLESMRGQGFGYPNLSNDAFESLLANAKKGGSSTSKVFDALNETSDFWGWVAENDAMGNEVFADGKDPDGNEILMASNGNFNVRIGAFWRGDQYAQASGEGGDETPIIGIMTIQTGETTTKASKFVSLAIGVVSAPLNIKLTGKLFRDLVKPLCKNVAKLLQKYAPRLQRASAVTEPRVRVAEETKPLLEDASAETEEVVGELAEEGVAYVAVEWADALLDIAGLGVLIAIPLLISALGHAMSASIMIVNKTDQDFKWEILKQVHGEASVLPATPDGATCYVIPKMDYDTDMWGDQTTVKAAYEANLQLINSSNLGAIGCVLQLTPQGADGGPAGTAAKLTCSIPWAGENTIWVGQSDADPGDVYEAHSIPDGRLVVDASFATYKVTLSTDALSGRDDAKAYEYCLMAVIEPV